MYLFFGEGDLYPACNIKIKVPFVMAFTDPRDEYTLNTDFYTTMQITSHSKNIDT